jgi:hypothetical protein
MLHTRLGNGICAMLSTTCTVDRLSAFLDSSRYAGVIPVLGAHTDIIHKLLRVVFGDLPEHLGGFFSQVVKVMWSPHVVFWGGI